MMGRYLYGWPSKEGSSVTPDARVTYTATQQMPSMPDAGVQTRGVEQHADSKLCASTSTHF